MLSRDLRSLTALLIDHVDPWAGGIAFPPAFTGPLTGVLKDLIAQAEAMERTVVPTAARGVIPAGVADFAAARARRVAREVS